MRSTLFRRLGLAAAGSAAVLATALSLSAPAQAAPAQDAQAASACHILNGLSQEGSFVIAERSRFCPPDIEVPLNTTLQQKNSVTGAFVDVASGLGGAAYHCTGTAPRTYKVKFTTQVKTFNCS